MSLKRLTLAACAALAAFTFAGLARAQGSTSAPPSARFEGLYPEGPVVIDDALYVAEMTGHRVTRLTEDAAAPNGYRREVFFQRDGCGPTALAEIAEGRIAVLCHLEGGVAILDRQGRLLRMIYESVDGVRLDSPNDISADGAGGAFFSNAGIFNPRAPAMGRVMRLGTDLTVSTVADGLKYANGVAVDRAGARVLVSEHLAQRVLAFPLHKSLTRLGAPKTLLTRKRIAAAIELGDAITGPDGLEIAPDGSVLVSIYGGGGYLKLTPQGDLTRHGAETRFLCATAVWGERVVLAGAYRNDRPPLAGLIEIRDGY